MSNPFDTDGIDLLFCDIKEAETGSSEAAFKMVKRLQSFLVENRERDELLVDYFVQILDDFFNKKTNSGKPLSLEQAFKLKRTPGGQLKPIEQDLEIAREVDRYICLYKDVTVATEELGKKIGLAASRCRDIYYEQKYIIDAENQV